jgi:hypothetical protein
LAVSAKMNPIANLDSVHEISISPGRHELSTAAP